MLPSAPYLRLGRYNQPVEDPMALYCMSGMACFNWAHVPDSTVILGMPLLCILELSGIKDLECLLSCLYAAQCHSSKGRSCYVLASKVGEVAGMRTYPCDLRHQLR